MDSHSAVRSAGYPGGTICIEAPEARKNIAPAERPGDPMGENAGGPEGRKINSNNLTPLWGWAHDRFKTPAFGPQLSKLTVPFPALVEVLQKTLETDLKNEN